MSPQAQGHTDARHGFTLIELLIVVAIISILAAIASPNFLSAMARSRYCRAKADMRALSSAIEPALTIFIGGMVGAIAVAVILPMYSLMGAIS